MLNLSGNNLNAEASALLVQARMPMLASLDLAENELDSMAMMHLRKGVWPNLLRLQLHINRLNDAAMFWLARAAWGNLNMLSLHKNKLSTFGVQTLATGTIGVWPHLSRLFIDESNISTKAIQVLKLTPAIMCYDDCLIACKSDRVVWPELGQVLIFFSRGIASRHITPQACYRKFNAQLPQYLQGVMCCKGMGG